jgi:agmatine deiminase
MSRIPDRTSPGEGFRMAAEWRPQAMCWMLWPERPDVWRRAAGPAQAAFAALAAAIARFQPVTVGASAAAYGAARAALHPAVRVIELSGDDAWMRDTGPTFTINARGAVRGVHWKFDAWGGLYADCRRDRDMGAKVCELAGIDRYRADLVAEGGALNSDGEGTVLTTEECLLSRAGAKALGRAGVEGRLRTYLGARRVIWLGQGVPGDETGGHVDNLCCFVRPGVVALAWTDEPRHPLYKVCRDALARLKAARDARGRRIGVQFLPPPAPLRMTAREAGGVQARAGSKRRRAGDALTASYTNVYLANGAVIVPSFNHAHDRLARQAWRRLCPDRKIVSVPAREIVLGGGGIHCVTLGQPRGKNP